MSNCYDFDGKLKKIFGQDKLFIDELESSGHQTTQLWMDNFEYQIKRFLIQNDIVDDIDFDLNKIHEYVSEEYQITDTNGDGISKLGQMFYEYEDAEYSENYYQFLKDMRDNVLKCDFYFQKTPTVRFWFKGQETMTKYHTDMDLGHPPQEINLWLALTKNEQTGFVIGDNLKDSEDWYSSYDFDRVKFYQDAESKETEEFDEFGKSITSDAESNRIIIFDSRMIHSAIDRSDDDTTRVSIDVRINPVEDFVDGYVGKGRMSAEFKPAGRFGYHEKSIDEIWSYRR